MINIDTADGDSDAYWYAFSPASLLNGFVTYYGPVALD